jgi:hypothetical protein
MQWLRKAVALPFGSQRDRIESILLQDALLAQNESGHEYRGTTQRRLIGHVSFSSFSRKLCTASVRNGQLLYNCQVFREEFWAHVRDPLRLGRTDQHHGTRQTHSGKWLMREVHPGRVPKRPPVVYVKFSKREIR